MFEDKIIQLLNSIFNSYIEGIDQSKLSQMNLWGGKIVLNNLQIRPDAFDILELPFHLTFGLLGSVTIKIQIPLLTLSRKNLTLEISDFLVLMTTKPETQWDPEQYRDEYISNKIALLSAESLELVVNQLEGNGFVWNTVLSFLETLEVTITNLHIRIEDYTTNNNVAYAFGCVIKNAFFMLNTDRSKDIKVELPFQTLFTNDGKLDQSIKHRTIDLEGFALYIDELDPWSHIKPLLINRGDLDLSELSPKFEKEQKVNNEDVTSGKVSKNIKRKSRKKFASKVYPRSLNSSVIYKATYRDEETVENSKEPQRVIEHTNTMYTKFFSSVLDYISTSQHHDSCSYFEELTPENEYINNTVWEKSHNSHQTINYFGVHKRRNRASFKSSKNEPLDKKRKKSYPRSSFKPYRSDQDFLISNVFKKDSMYNDPDNQEKQASHRDQSFRSKSWRIYLSSFCDPREKAKKDNKSSSEIINNALKRRRKNSYMNTSPRSSKETSFDVNNKTTKSPKVASDRSSPDSDFIELSVLRNPDHVSGSENLDDQDELDDEILDQFERRVNNLDDGAVQEVGRSINTEEDTESHDNEFSIEGSSSSDTSGTTEESEEYTTDEEEEVYETEEGVSEQEEVVNFECKVDNVKQVPDTPTTMETEALDDDSWTCITYVVKNEFKHKLPHFLEKLNNVEHNYILNTRDFKGLGSFFFCTYPILPSKKYTSCWSDWGSRYGRVPSLKNEYLPRCSIFFVFEDLDVIVSKEQIECVFNLIYHNVYKYSYWLSGVISTFESARADPEYEKLYMEYWPQSLLLDPNKENGFQTNDKGGKSRTSTVDEIMFHPDNTFQSESYNKVLTGISLRQFVSDFEILNSIPTIRILRNKANAGLEKLVRGFAQGPFSLKVGSNINECITGVLFTNICSSYNDDDSKEGAMSSRLQERLQFVGGIYEIVSKQSNSGGMLNSLKKLCTQQTFTVDVAFDLLFINSRLIVTNNMHTATDETNVKGYIMCANGLHIFCQDTFGRDGSQFIEVEASPLTIFSLDISVPCAEDFSTYINNLEMHGPIDEYFGLGNNCACDILSGTPCILLTCGDCNVDPMKTNKKNILSLLLGEDDEDSLLPPVIYFSLDYNHYRVPETSDIRVRFHIDSDLFMHFPIIDELNHVLRIYKYNMDRHSSTCPIKIDDDLKRIEYLAKEDSVVYELVDLGIEYQRCILQGLVSYLNYDVNIDIDKGLFLMFDVNLKGSYFTYSVTLDLLTVKTLTRWNVQDESSTFSPETVESDYVSEDSYEIKQCDPSCFNNVKLFSSNNLKSCLPNSFNDELYSQSKFISSSYDHKEFKILNGEVKNYRNGYTSDYFDRDKALDGYDTHVCVISGLNLDCLNDVYNINERSLYMGKKCSFSLNNYLMSVMRIKTKYMDKMENMKGFMKYFENKVNILTLDRDIKVVVRTATNIVGQNSPNLIVSLDIGSLYVNLRDVDMVGLICSLLDYKQIILKYAIKLDVVSEQDIESNNRNFDKILNKYHNNNYISQLKTTKDSVDYFDDMMLNAYYNWNLLQENQMGERTKGFIKYEIDLDFFNLTFRRLITFNTTNSYYSAFKDLDNSSRVNSQNEGSSTNHTAQSSMSKENVDNIRSKLLSKVPSSSSHTEYDITLDSSYDFTKLEDFVKFYGISTPLLSVKITGFGFKVGLLDTKIERICSYIGSFEVEDQSNCVPLYMSTLFSGGNTTMLWSWLRVKRQYSEFCDKVSSFSHGEGKKTSCTVSRIVYDHYKRVQRYINSTMNFDAHSHNHIYNADDQENLDRIVDTLTQLHQKKSTSQVDLEKTYLIGRNSSPNTDYDNISNVSSNINDGDGTSISKIINQYRDDYTTKSKISVSSHDQDEGLDYPQQDNLKKDAKENSSKELGFVGSSIGGCPCFISLSLISGTTRSCSIYISSSIVTLPWELSESLATYFNSIHAYIKDNTNNSSARDENRNEMYKDDDYSEYTDDMSSSDITIENDDTNSLCATASVADPVNVGEDDETIMDSVSSSCSKSPTGNFEQNYSYVSKSNEKPLQHDKKFSFHIHVGISCINMLTESAWTGYGYFLKYFYHRTTKKESKTNPNEVRWALVRNILRDKNRKAYMIYPITMNITGQGSLYITHTRVNQVTPPKLLNRQKTMIYRNTKFDLHCRESIDKLFDGWFSFMPCVFEVSLSCRNVSVKLTREASGVILTPCGYTLCDIYIDLSNDFRKKRASFIKFIKMSLLLDKKYHSLLNLAKNSLFDPTNLNTSRIVDPFRSNITVVFYLYGNDRNMWSNQIMPQSASLHLKVEPLNITINSVDLICLIDFFNLLYTLFNLFKCNYTLVLHASNEFLSLFCQDLSSLDKIRITKLFSNLTLNESEYSDESSEVEVYEEEDYDSCESSNDSSSTDLNNSTSRQRISKGLNLENSEYDNYYTYPHLLTNETQSCGNLSGYKTDYRMNSNLESYQSESSFKRYSMDPYESRNEFSQFYENKMENDDHKGLEYSEKDEIMSDSTADYEDPEDQGVIIRILSSISVGVSVELELVNLELSTNVTSGMKHVFTLTMEDTEFCFWVNNIFDCEYLESTSRIVSFDFGAEDIHKGTWFNDPLLHRETNFYNVGEIERENSSYLEQFSGVLRGGVLEISRSSLPQTMKYNSSIGPDTHIILESLDDARTITVRESSKPFDLNLTSGKDINEQNKNGRDFKTNAGDDVVVLIDKEFEERNVTYSIRMKRDSQKRENLIGVSMDAQDSIGLEDILHFDEVIDVENIPSIASLNKLLGSASEDEDDEKEEEYRDIDHCYKENVKNFIQFRFKTNITFDLSNYGNQEMTVETFTVSLMGYKPTLACKLFSRLEASWINVNVTLNLAECYFGSLAYFIVMLKLRQILNQYSIDESKLLDSVTKYTINDYVPNISMPIDFNTLGFNDYLNRQSREYFDSVTLSKFSKDLSEYSINKLSRDLRISKDLRLSKIISDHKVPRMTMGTDLQSYYDVYSMPIKNVTNPEMFAKYLAYRYFNGLLQPSGVMDVNALISERLKSISEVNFYGIKKIEPIYLSYLKFDQKDQETQSSLNLDEESEEYDDFTEKDIYNVPIEHNVVHVGKLGHANVFGRNCGIENESRLYNNLGFPILLAIKSTQTNYLTSINTVATLNSKMQSISNVHGTNFEHETVDISNENLGYDDSYTWIVLKDGESHTLPSGHYGILEPFLIRVQIENKFYEIASNLLELNENNNQIMLKLNLKVEGDKREDVFKGGVQRSYPGNSGIAKFAKDYFKRLIGSKYIQYTYDYAYLMVKLVKRMSLETSNTNSSILNIHLSSGISVTNKSMENLVIYPTMTPPENKKVARENIVRMQIKSPIVPDRQINKNYFREDKLTEFDKLFKPISVLTEHKLVKKFDPELVEEPLASTPQAQPVVNRYIKGIKLNTSLSEEMDQSSGDGLQYIVLKGDLNDPSKVYIPLPWILRGTNTICVSLLSDFTSCTNLNREDSQLGHLHPGYYNEQISCDVLLSVESSLHIISSFEGQKIKLPVPGYVPTLNLGNSSVSSNNPSDLENLNVQDKNLAEKGSSVILSSTLSEVTSVHKTQIPLNLMKHCLKQYEFIIEPCQIIENMMPYDINILVPRLYSIFATKSLKDTEDYPKLKRAMSFDNVYEDFEKKGEKPPDTLSRSISISNYQLSSSRLVYDVKQEREREIVREEKEHLYIKSGSSVHLDRYMRKSRIFFKDFCSNEIQFKNENVNSTLVFEKIRGVLLENCAEFFGVDSTNTSSNLPVKISVALEISKRSSQPTKDKEGLIRRCLASSQIVCIIYAEKWVVNWLEYPILLSKSDGRYIQCFGGNCCSLVSQDLSNTGLHIVLRKANLKMIHSYEMYPTNPRTWSGFRVTSPSHLISDKFLLPELTFSTCSIKDLQNYPNLHYLVSTSIAPFPFFRTVVLEILPQVTMTNDFDMDIWVREYMTSKNVVKTVIKKTGFLPKLYSKINSLFHRIHTNTRPSKGTIVEQNRASRQIVLKKYKRNLDVQKRMRNRVNRPVRNRAGERRAHVSTHSSWIKIDSGMTAEFHPQVKGEFYVEVTAINPEDFKGVKNVRFWSSSLLIKPSSSTQFRYPQCINWGKAFNGSGNEDGGERGFVIDRLRTNRGVDGLIKYGLCEVETMVHKGCKMVRFCRPKMPEWVIINSTGFNLYIQQLGVLSHGEILAPNKDLIVTSRTVGLKNSREDQREFLDVEFRNGVEYSWYDPLKEQKLIIKLYHMQDKGNDVIGKYLNKTLMGVEEESLFVKARGVLLIDLGRVESINTSNIFNMKIGKMRLVAKFNAQTSVIMGQRTLILTCGKLNKTITRNKKLFGMHRQIKIKIHGPEDMASTKRYILDKFKYNMENNIRNRGIRVASRSTTKTYPITGGLMNTSGDANLKSKLRNRSTKQLYLHHTSIPSSRQSFYVNKTRHTYPLTQSPYSTTFTTSNETVINITSDYTLNVSINGLGLCICSYLPDELLYLSLVMVKFNTSFQDSETRHVFSVGWLQSDVHDADSFFPTMLKPVINYSAFNIGSINRKKASSYVHHDIITNSRKEVINILMNTKSNRYIKEISLLSIDIQPININVDTRIIFSSLLLLDDYLSIFSQSERSIESFSSPLVGIFNYENMESFDDEAYMLKDIVTSQYGSEVSGGSRYNISRLLIGKIVMVINIRRSDAIQMDELPPLSPMVRYLLYIVRRTPHISDAHIVLNKESLLRLCCTPYVLMSHFASRYISQAMHQIYKVLWAVDLIGNPKIIFNHWFSALYQSLIDFREALRFVHLPPVTFLLLLKGVSQFGISVLSGIVDAFYRFTGSWCLLLNTMALNSDRYAVFLLNEVFPKSFGHPSNLFEGLYFGTMMMGRNAYISLGNFVFKPVSSFNKFIECIRTKSGKKNIFMSFVHIWTSVLSSVSSLVFGILSSLLSGLSISFQGLLSQMHSVPMLSAIRPRRSFQHLKGSGPVRYNFLESWSMEASKRLGHTNQVLLVLPLDVKLRLYDPIYLATSHWSILATHISSISPLILSQSFGNFKDLIWIDRLNLGYVEKRHVKWRYSIRSIKRIQLIELYSVYTGSKDDVVDVPTCEVGGDKGEDVKVVVYDSFINESKIVKNKAYVILPLKLGRKMVGKKMYFMRIIFSEPGYGAQFQFNDKKKLPTRLETILKDPNFLLENYTIYPPQHQQPSQYNIHDEIHENLDRIKLYLTNNKEFIDSKNNLGYKDTRLNKHGAEEVVKKVYPYNGLYVIDDEVKLTNVDEYLSDLNRIEYKNIDEGEYDFMIQNQHGSNSHTTTNSVDAVKPSELRDRVDLVESSVNNSVEDEEKIYNQFESIISKEGGDRVGIGVEGRFDGVEDKCVENGVRGTQNDKEGEEEVVEIVKMTNLETGKLYFTLLTSVLREVAI